MNTYHIPFIFFILFMSGLCTHKTYGQSSIPVEVKFFTPPDYSDDLKIAATRNLKVYLNKIYRSRIIISDKEIEDNINNFDTELNIKPKGEAKIFIFGGVKRYQGERYHISLYLYHWEGVKKNADGTITISHKGASLGEENRTIESWQDSGVRIPEINKLCEILFSEINKLLDESIKIQPMSVPSFPEINKNSTQIKSKEKLEASKDTTSTFNNNKKLRVDTKRFTFSPDSKKIGFKEDFIIREFCIEAEKSVRYQLGTSLYARTGIRHSDEINFTNTWIEDKDGYKPVSVGIGTNVIISGSVLYGQNEKAKITMKLYTAQAKDKNTKQVIFYESARISRKKSINFIKEKEKTDRLIRRMTNRLVAPLNIANFQISMIGLSTLSMGIAYFGRTKKNYGIYKENRYRFDPVYADYLPSDNPRGDYFKSLKRGEVFSYTLSGIGIAMTTWGSYRIINNIKKRKVFNQINPDLRAEVPTTNSNTAITISSTINQNSITGRTNLLPKLTYHF